MTLTFKERGLKILLGAIVKLLWTTCRIDITIDTQSLKYLQSDTPVIPCYWHQQHIFGVWCLLHLKKHYQKNIVLLASPSRDAEIAGQIIKAWGLNLIRGSSSKTGAQALRDLCKSVNNDGVSPSISPDGPRGPIFEAKPGAILTAQHTSCPILPIVIHAENEWQLRSWDKFSVPKPFSKVTITIKAAMTIDKKLAMADLPAKQKILTATLKQTNNDKN